MHACYLFVKTTWSRFNNYQCINDDEYVAILLLFGEDETVHTGTITHFYGTRGIPFGDSGFCNIVFVPTGWRCVYRRGGEAMLSSWNSSVRFSCVSLDNLFRCDFI